jgi:hypothetical protein
MSKLLDEAIQTLRDLPDEDQDAAADVLFAYMSNDERQYHLGPDQAEAVRRIRRDLSTGKSRLATAEEVAAVRNPSRL